ncbi:hypothetical protein [Aquimarina litoralis]|uniref:hypothetical protein n=1 Tax=Aquimarina litoralis TaxID=584605 RepID=UPI001C593464|nr:hypothetical protein [Aquimarina litoralis]MBW1295853.1 hypothetical protein [Aquimarina litoralis]
MKNTFKICLFLLILSFHSCSSTKTADGNDGKESAQNVAATDMTQKGFKKATLSTSKSKDCPYILSVDDSKEQLDPINILDFFENEVPEKVWVKYGNLRMRNRCVEARPVTIIEISKRAD